MSGNIEKIKRAVAESEIDALMLESPVNRLYATGFESTDGIAVITEDDAWFFTDSRYIEAAENTVSGAHVLMTDAKNPYSSRISAVIADTGIRRLGFEEKAVTFADYILWKEKLNAELVPAQEILTDLRASKSREELELLIRAQRLAEKSFNEVLPLISTDMTEKELAAELTYRFLKNGAEGNSFDPIVVSAERSSMPHGVPSDAKIKKGFLTMDFGVRLGGWCSDTTRTVCIGEPTEEMRRVYDTVLGAQLRGIETARAGIPGREIDGAARDYIHGAGYGGYFGHGFGHGVGLEVHEVPTASPSGTQPMPVGAVISAEPGIYIPGKFGVRIEDVLYLTENGCENLTTLPKELIIL